MQVFIFDRDITNNAQFYCDKHVVKIPLEITQILCTSVRVLNGYNEDDIYKITHKNHPWCKFGYSSEEAFIYLYNLGYSLFKEYTYRYNRTHKSEVILTRCLEIIEYKNRDVDFDSLTFPLCIPEQYKTKDAIESYRNYCLGEKHHIGKWTNRPKPYWWK